MPAAFGISKNALVDKALISSISLGLTYGVAEVFPPPSVARGGIFGLRHAYSGEWEKNPVSFQVFAPAGKTVGCGLYAEIFR